MKRSTLVQWWQIVIDLDRLCSFLPWVNCFYYDFVEHRIHDSSSREFHFIQYQKRVFWFYHECFTHLDQWEDFSWLLNRCNRSYIKMKFHGREINPTVLRYSALVSQKMIFIILGRDQEIKRIDSYVTLHFISSRPLPFIFFCCQLPLCVILCYS